ncbi:LysR substrate-binding domain-containing protein [Variovorax sp. VNK109]|uniref:LysR family transcriptional regulator n=1 Tax=Variovorax sp. VNK109 TaxID=3400919 RepID=UPI003BFC49FB
MDLKQLEYFVHVAELGSFTKASDLLGIAQSALSRHVRKLEVELGQNLLHRDGRGVSPTEAGKRLLSHGHGILLQVQRAHQEVADVRGAPIGNVVIGLPHSLGRILTVPFVSEFQRAFPHAQLSITEGLTIHLHEWLKAGRLDISVLHDPVPSPSIETFPLQQDDYFLLCPGMAEGARGKTVQLADLAGYPLILPRRPHPMRLQLETQLANLGRKPQVALEIDAVPAIADLVAQGLGYGLVTMNALRVHNGPAQFSFRRIVSPAMRSTLVLGISAERPLTDLAQKTVEMLRSFIPAHLQQRQPRPISKTRNS